MNLFQNLFILGRAASGKSELIDFVKKMPEEERKSKLHIGCFEEIDDFPWIWEAGTTDDEREALGLPRLYTEKTPECFNLTVPKFRGSLIEKFNSKITEKYLNRPDFYKNNTLFIEFARGKGDGFKDSLVKFKREILETAAIFYIDVSFKDSCRRNDARYKEAQKKSILFHKVPDKDMNEYFCENDWAEITEGKPFGYLQLNGINVPFVTMKNEPELPPGPEIFKRYETSFSKLFEVYKGKVCHCT